MTRRPGRVLHPRPVLAGMSRRALAAAAVAVGLGACAAGDRPGAPPPDPAAVRARVELAPGPPGATALWLSIGAVTNRDRVPVSLAVTLVDEGPAGGATVRGVPLGTVSLFPSDRPGQFVLRLPPWWRPPARGDATVPATTLVLTLVGADVPGASPVALADVSARLIVEPR